MKRTAKAILVAVLAILTVSVALTAVYAETAQPDGVTTSEMTVTREPNSDAEVTSEATGEVDYTELVVILCVSAVVVAVIVVSIAVVLHRKRTNIVQRAIDAARREKEKSDS